MPKTYHRHDERGFANQYTLAVASNAEIAESLRERGFRRITRTSWIYSLRLRHNHAGFITTGRGPFLSSQIDEIIEDCARATKEYTRNPYADSEGYVTDRLR